MGFCYNYQRQLLSINREQNAVEDEFNKREKKPSKHFIPVVRVKQLRHKLSARDRTFLRSIGLKLKNNS